MLVDGTKEGAVVSVNGNTAQVSLWDTGGAAVNVARLSPLEVEDILTPHQAATDAIRDYERWVEIETAAAKAGRNS